MNYDHEHFEYTPDGDKIDQRNETIAKLKREVMRYQLAAQERQLLEIQDKHYRESIPAIKEAWDRYQVVLKLAK